MDAWSEHQAWGQVMSVDAMGRSPSYILPDELERAFSTLLEAFDFADDASSNRWNFAVGIGRLQADGLNETHLRWLVLKRYVEHAREVTVEGDDGREFRSTGNLTFTRRTSFVLTETGVAKARSMSRPGLDKPQRKDTTLLPGGKGQPAQTPVVHWDADARKLYANGKLAKRFKWSAANQEAVLSAFQEEGWPERIDDPLPPQPEQDSKRRLSDTIKCLNRKQVSPLIHFRGDGTGEGVVWELVRPNSGANGAE